MFSLLIALCVQWTACCIFVDSVPESIRYDNSGNKRKLAWTKVSDKDLRQYNLLTDRSLNSINVQRDVLLCHKVNCYDIW